MEINLNKKATIEVHLQPGAKRNEIAGFREGILYAKVTALPHKGQANRALLQLISQTLGVPKSNVEIIRGLSSRNKVISIYGLTNKQVNEILDQDVPCKDLIDKIANKSNS